jgi:hypothetical protein
VGFVFFNKQSSPYTLQKKVKFSWVYEISDFHISFVIDVEFHHVALKVQLGFIVIY